MFNNKSKKNNVELIFISLDSCYVMSNDHVTKIENRMISKIDIRTSIFIRHNAWIEQCISFLKFSFFSFSRFNFVITFIHNVIFANFQRLINAILFNHSIVKFWLQFWIVEIRVWMIVRSKWQITSNWIRKHQTTKKTISNRFHNENAKKTNF